MSKQATADIHCERCEHEFETQVYTSVNVKQNPELRQQILNGTFFKQKCPSCNSIINSLYDVLYHDPDQKFMVWLVKPDSDNMIFLQRNSLRIIEILDDYRLNISRYPYQWIERIITLEFRIDPRIIELYKFGEKERKKLPLNTENDFLHFCKYTRNLLGRTSFHWMLVYDDGEIETYSKPVDVNKYESYKNLINSLEPTLKPTSWYLIDWQFPFGKEIHDDELIQLPLTSDFIEIGDNKSKLPRQFLDVVERTGKGRKI